MFTISWGTNVSVVVDTAAQALKVAEEYFAARRPDVTITDRPTGLPITLEDLRRRAAVEAQDKQS